jgi:hypothetical protein
MRRVEVQRGNPGAGVGLESANVLGRAYPRERSDVSNSLSAELLQRNPGRERSVRRRWSPLGSHLDRLRARALTPPDNGRCCLRIRLITATSFTGSSMSRRMADF